MKKIKELVKKYSKEILLSTIVSLLTASIIKGIGWIKEIAPTAGNSVLRFISNSFYSNLAKTDEFSLLTMLFALFIGIVVVYVFNMFKEGFVATKIVIKGSEKIERYETEEIETTLQESTENRKPTDDKETTNDLKDVKKMAKKLRTMLILTSIFFSIYFTHILCSYLVPNAVYRDFQRDLTQISPYIEQQELDIIRSDWVCMQTKEDYDAIYERINQVKEEHDLP